MADLYRANYWGNYSGDICLFFPQNPLFFDRSVTSIESAGVYSIYFRNNPQTCDLLTSWVNLCVILLAYNWKS